MSVLERRLQILLDGARYERLAREAEATGHSVAAIVREAIDLRPVSYTHLDVYKRQMPTRSIFSASARIWEIRDSVTPRSSASSRIGRSSKKRPRMTTCSRSGSCLLYTSRCV